MRGSLSANATAKLSYNIPDWMKWWQSEHEANNKGVRQKWSNRNTFIMATIGSSIGLGNFWRFPALTYKHGGA